MGSRKPQKRKGAENGNGSEPYAGRLNSIFAAISLPPFSFLIIACVMLACYAQTLAFDFTRFDDDLIVTKNIEYYKDLSNIGTSFTRDAYNGKIGYAFYRPIQNLSFFVDARISGTKPIGFKITNLVLHLLTCFCLLFLFNLLHLDHRLSFLAVLIYSVHPLFNHAVIWIPARGDLFIALFGVVSYIGFMKYLETRGIHYLILHTAAFFLAAFSKETALLLPLLLTAHICIFRRPVKSWRRHLPVGFCWIAVVCLYLYFRHQAMVATLTTDAFGIGPFVSNLQVVPEFLAKFILPVNLAVLPVFSLVSTLSGVIFLIILGWHIARTFKGGKQVYLLGTSWFLVFTAVTMLYRHELGKAGYDYLEHRAYLPMIGILMILVTVVQENLKRWNIKTIYTIGMVVTVVFSAVTLVHSKSYESPLAFYSSAIRSNPGCALAYYNRAQFRRSLGDRSGAIKDYDEAIRVKPDLSDAYYNRANAKKEVGDLNGALQDYGLAIQCDGGFTLAYYNRGTVRLSLGDNLDAISDLSQAVVLDPANVNALSNRGAAYYKLDRMDAALADFNRVLELDPKYADAWRNRGSVKFKRRDVAGACADWRIADKAGSMEGAKLFQEFCR
jgi:protein O-mannosyl-transferase